MSIPPCPPPGARQKDRSRRVVVELLENTQITFTDVADYPAAPSVQAGTAAQPPHPRHPVVELFQPDGFQRSPQKTLRTVIWVSRRLGNNRKRLPANSMGQSLKRQQHGRLIWAGRRQEKGKKGSRLVRCSGRETGWSERRGGFRTRFRFLLLGGGWNRQPAELCDGREHRRGGQGSSRSHGVTSRKAVRRRS
jgi:hypothetical protein